MWSVQDGPCPHLDDRTHSFLVDGLRLKGDFILTVDEMSPPIAVNMQQVPHSSMPLSCCWVGIVEVSIVRQFDVCGARPSLSL